MYRGRSVTEPTVLGSMPLIIEPEMLPSDETITSLRMNGVAPAMPRTFSTFACTSSHSGISGAYFMTTPCELVPRIFFCRSASKPLITESTMISAITPTPTPPTESAVIIAVGVCA